MTLLRKLFEIMWWYVEDTWKPAIGYTLIFIGLISFAVVFPYILILYVLGIGGALIRN